MNKTYTSFVTCYECSEDLEIEFERFWDEGGEEYSEPTSGSWDCPNCGDEDFMGGCGDDGAQAAEKRAMMAD